MEETLAATARYWCHACSRVISPIVEVEIKCPSCGDGFVEEISSTNNNQDVEDDFDSNRERALSLWAPVLLGMMGNQRRRWHTIQRLDFDANDEDESRHAGGTEIDHQIESIIQRRRRTSATILQLLQGIRERAGISSELETLDPGEDREDDGDDDRERERVFLINPFSQTILVQGSSNESSQTSDLVGSLGDYFVGPRLDTLLQHLSENDPNRYGTPPAQKEAIEAMPTVKIEENVQCAVCLDDFEVGTKARVMPCKHNFHEGCILPWLELHSSCPVCRYQLPAEEIQNDPNGSREGNSGGEQERENGIELVGGGGGNESDENRRNESGRRFQFPWPFNSLFSSSPGSQPNTAGNSTNSSSLSPSSTNDS